MPYPKGIKTAAVRERFLTERRAMLATYDELCAAGKTQREAAACVGVTTSGIDAMRRSVEHLSENAPYHGGKGNQSIDLGLALLSVLRKDGEPLALEDIAAWCGCSRSAVFNIENRAKRKVRRALLEATRGSDLAAEVEELLGGHAL